MDPQNVNSARKRIVKYTQNEKRDELGISSMVYDLWLHKNSEIEVLSTITLGSRHECLSRGKMLHGLDEFIRNN